MIEVPFSAASRTSYDGARRANPVLEWLQSPARPALQVASALDRVRRAPTILSAMRVVPELMRVVDRSVHEGISATVLLEPILEAVADDTDSVTALAAVHALGRVPGVHADDALADLMMDAVTGLDNHATWVLGSRPSTPGLMRLLARAVALGDIAGMHAQRALATWATTDPGLVLAALESALRETGSADVRRHLVETIGLVPGQRARGSSSTSPLMGRSPSPCAPRRSLRSQSD